MSTEQANEVNINSTDNQKISLSTYCNSIIEKEESLELP